jgi:hypothetical protein
LIAKTRQKFRRYVGVLNFFAQIVGNKNPYRFDAAEGFPTA